MRDLFYHLTGAAEQEWRQRVHCYYIILLLQRSLSHPLLGNGNCEVKTKEYDEEKVERGEEGGGRGEEEKERGGGCLTVMSRWFWDRIRGRVVCNLVPPLILII